MTPQQNFHPIHVIEYEQYRHTGRTKPLLPYSNCTTHSMQFDCIISVCCELFIYYAVDEKHKWPRFDDLPDILERSTFNGIDPEPRTIGRWNVQSDSITSSAL
jgi:hypothetical protein